MVDTVIEADPVAAAVRVFMTEQLVGTNEWTGTVSALLGQLSVAAGEVQSRSKGWPLSADGVGRRLRRAATFLRKIGIEIQSGSHHGRARTITITRRPR